MKYANPDNYHNYKARNKVKMIVNCAVDRIDRASTEFSKIIQVPARQKYIVFHLSSHAESSDRFCHITQHTL